MPKAYFTEQKCTFAGACNAQYIILAYNVWNLMYTGTASVPLANIGCDGAFARSGAAGMCMDVIGSGSNKLVCGIVDTVSRQEKKNERMFGG